MKTRKALGVSKRMLQHGIVLLCAAACFAALADEAYLAKSDANRTSSYTNSVNWLKGSTSGNPLGPAGAAIDSEYDYIVPKNTTLRTPTTSATFGGKSLTVNSGGVLSLCAGGAGCEYTFSGVGLIQKGSLVSLWANNPVVKGNVTIPANARVEMYDNNASSSIGFDCSLSGQSSSTLWAYGYNDTKCTVRFKGSTLSGYSGSIVCCTQDYAHRNTAPVPAQATTLSIGTVETSASVTIHPYCTITAESAGDVVSLASLEMKTNSTMTVAYSKSSKTASCIKVIGTFTHNEGPVKIDVTGNGATSDCEWPDSELPILKAPAGITLSANDFVVVAAWPAYDLSVRTAEDGLSTLFIRQHGNVIIQESADVLNQKDTSSFCSGDKWKGGNIPDQYNCYYSAQGTQRAYGSPFPGYVFARQSGILALQLSNVRIDDFRIIGSATDGMGIYAYYNGATLEGRLHLVSGNNYTRLAGHQGTLTIASEIDGPGRIQIYGKTESKSIVTVRITNTNDLFTGWIESAVKSGNTPSDSVHSILEFVDGRSLGGAMSPWTYNGHTFNAYTYFTPLATTTLERENCGIFVDGFARIVCNDGITLTVKEKTTWNGELKKLGAGTLAWGGAAPSFTTDGGTTPVADKNLLVIAEGTLRPASSEAFRGVAVTIADGAGIGVEVQADDTTDLAQYGMDLRPAGSSLTIDAATLTPSVSVPAGFRKSVTVAICTVPAEVAASVRGKLDTSSYPPVGSVCMQGFERTNGDGSVTFGVTVRRLGTILTVR